MKKENIVTNDLLHALEHSTDITIFPSGINSVVKEMSGWLHCDDCVCKVKQGALVGVGGISHGNWKAGAFKMIKWEEQSEMEKCGKLVWGDQVERQYSEEKYGVAGQ